MAILELMKQRYSARRYQNKPIEEEKLALILEAGRVAPTACNYQPQKILVVQSKEGMEKLSRAYKSFGAPLALIVCADHNTSWHRSYDGKDSADIDAAIVTDHMMLCATELGLNSVWVCAFQPEVLRQEFHIPSHIEPINILMIGYADGQPRSPERHAEWRKPLSDTVMRESF